MAAGMARRLVPMCVTLALAAGIALAAGPHGDGALAIEDEPGVGAYLVDGAGRAVYAYSGDKGARGSTCTGACAVDWPPVIARPRTRVAPGLDPARLGWIERPDGTRQLTYGGWPLYHQAGRTDEDAPGETVYADGGAWFLVAPSGKIIHR